MWRKKEHNSLKAQSINMTSRIQQLIDQLELIPHPEGGFYKETYRSTETISDRNLMTSIYFLITGTNISRLHRIKSDEVWYFHEGSRLNVHTINEDGYHCIQLGLDLNNGEEPFALVKGGTIFGSDLESKNENDYALVSCAVAPGFYFNDFELFTIEQLLETHPQYEELIRRLT
jgi:predicted cupin superfamily sugar epimerase